MNKLDLKAPVKLKNPEKDENLIIYKITNYNEETQRCYIEPITLNLPVVPQELVSVDDLVNV